MMPEGLRTYLLLIEALKLKAVSFEYLLQDYKRCSDPKMPLPVEDLLSGHYICLLQEEPYKKDNLLFMLIDSFQPYTTQNGTGEAIKAITYWGGESTNFFLYNNGTALWTIVCDGDYYPFKYWIFRRLDFKIEVFKEVFKTRFSSNFNLKI